jgi:hypothetical protein
MYRIPPDLVRRYDAVLERKSITPGHRTHYQKVAAFLPGFLLQVLL